MWIRKIWRVIWHFQTIHKLNEGSKKCSTRISSYWIQSAQWHRVINRECDQYSEEIWHHPLILVSLGCCLNLRDTLRWTLPLFLSGFKWIQFPCVFSSTQIGPMSCGCCRFLQSLEIIDKVLECTRTITFTFHIPNTRNPGKWVSIHRWEFNSRPT